MQKKIDILLATYNSELYLAAQLQSIFNQSYQNFEIIIRDDASQDNTLKVINEFSEKYPGKIRLIDDKKNLGCRDNFALLMGHARCDYIFFSDADDVWLPTKIEKTMALMLEYEKKFGIHTPLLVHTDLQVVDRHLHLISSSFSQFTQINPSFGNQLNRLLIQNVVTGCTMLINRALLSLAYPIPPSAVMHDWWIALIACTFGQIIYLDQPTLQYRQHGNNAIGAKQGPIWKSPKGFMNELKKITHFNQRQVIRESLRKKFDQAQGFYDRFYDKADQKNQLLLQNFIVLTKSNPIKKRYLLIKNGYFMTPFLKNLGAFLFI